VKSLLSNLSRKKYNYNKSNKHCTYSNGNSTNDEGSSQGSTRSKESKRSKRSSASKCSKRQQMRPDIVEEEDDGDFLMKQGNVKYDYFSKLHSKTKADILTPGGFLKGNDYTFNQMKAGSMMNQVIEVFEFYCSDMDRYYENLHDYIHDYLVQFMETRQIRYFEKDLFQDILICDLCMKLGHTYNTCTLKYEACVYCGS
jgi:hypothetical protein